MPQLQHLTEGAFRRLWSKTKGDDKARYRQVLDILKGGVPPGYKNQLVKPGYRPALIEIMSDSKWWKRSELAAELEERFGDVLDDAIKNAICSLQRSPAKGRRLESRRSGSSVAYRLVSCDDDPAREAVVRLYDQAQPLIDQIKFWGNQHPAEMSPQSILQIGVKLERLFAAVLRLENEVSR